MKKLHYSSKPTTQRGVVLLFSLIALVIMLIGSVALVRSFNTTLFSAGNVAFKRDLQNQGERIVPKIQTVFQTTGAAGLATADERKTSKQALNYSARILPSNSQGIPLALLSNSTFTTIGTADNDVLFPDQKVEIRYVIDRLCNVVGDEAVLGNNQCQVAAAVPKGTSVSDLNKAQYSSGKLAGAEQPQIVYRLSVRVSGPRETQAFFQSTFTL